MEDKVIFQQAFQYYGKNFSPRNPSAPWSNITISGREATLSIPSRTNRLVEMAEGLGE